MSFPLKLCYLVNLKLCNKVNIRICCVVTKKLNSCNSEKWKNEWKSHKEKSYMRWKCQQKVSFDVWKYFAELKIPRESTLISDCGFFEVPQRSLNFNGKNFRERKKKKTNSHWAWSKFTLKSSRIQVKKIFRMKTNVG